MLAGRTVGAMGHPDRTRKDPYVPHPAALLGGFTLFLAVIATVANLLVYFSTH